MLCLATVFIVLFSLSPVVQPVIIIIVVAVLLYTHLTLCKCIVLELISNSLTSLFVSEGIFLANRSQRVHLVNLDRCSGNSIMLSDNKSKRQDNIYLYTLGMTIWDEDVLQCLRKVDIDTLYLEYCCMIVMTLLSLKLNLHTVGVLLSILLINWCLSHAAWQHNLFAVW